LKQQLGYLPTEPYYFSKITGREYIHLICNARGHRGVDPDLKNIFDLPLNQYAITYSTGMKKKLALTAILMIPNEIYILDEPFNGVDIHSNRIISEIIHMIREAGKTLLLSSHIFSTLKETCDEIHQLKEGRFIRSTGTDGFDELEQAMTGTEIHEKIGRLKFG
jgi:ABC-2 type transport system ATP-binding protein